MHYSNIALVATPVFFAYVSAYGSTIVKNSCGDDVYFWSVGDSNGQMYTVPAGTSSSPQVYYSKTNGGGPSIKIGTRYTSGSKVGQIPGIEDIPEPPFMQLEFTVGTPGPPANQVWHDVSNINGYPFSKGGFKMTSSDGSCNVQCPAGTTYCQEAYNAPHDDTATGSSPDTADLTLEVCSDNPGITVGGANAGGQGGSGSGSGSSGGSSAGSSPAPSSSQAAAPPAPQSSSPPSNEGGNEKLAVANPPASSTSSPPATTPPPQAPEEDIVVVHTVYADPVIVTKHVNADGSYGSRKEKRHDHVHQHVHNKINKKRHGGN